MAVKRNTIKLPPQNIEAEQSVLGALVIDANALLKVVDVLKAEDFYKPEHQKIYAAIVDLFEAHNPIDILSVTNRLKEKDTYGAAGGSSYLAQLVESVPTAAHVAHYAQIVREKRVLRDLITASSEIADSAFSPTEDMEQMLDTVEQRIFSISQRSSQKKLGYLPDRLPEYIEEFEKRQSPDAALRGIQTGFGKLDNLLLGMQPSDFIVLGARPSVGKTSFALDVARHAAIKSGKTVGVFSLEMSEGQIFDRLVAAESHVPLWRIRAGRVKEDAHFRFLQETFDRLSRAKIYIDDTAAPNVMQIRSMARRLQIEQGLDFLIIDYLQLITPREGREMNMVQQVTEISRNLKSLARELNVPVLALSQLSRGIEQRGGSPKLSDLRESGSIEQDADVVLFLHKEADPNKQENIVQIIVAKHRNGATGVAELVFEQDYATFLNPSGPGYASDSVSASPASPFA